MVKDPRSYNRLIQIYRKDFVTDEFGGNVETNAFIKSIWAKITTNAGNKFVNFGIQDFKNPVIFAVRGRKNEITYDENYHIEYEDIKYFIKGMQDNMLEEMEFLIYVDSE